MSQQLINIGSVPNDGSGDSLRTAFAKINNNFTELYSYSSSNTFTYTVGTTAQSILQLPANSYTRGSFEIYSVVPTELLTVQITSISSTATDFTVNLPSIPPSWSVGSSVVISNTSPAAYNGTWTIATIFAGGITVTSAINPGVSTINGTINSYSSQSVKIDSFTIANSTDIKFSAHSTIFNGDPLTNYSMDVDSGNVRLIANPIYNNIAQHYITYKVTYTTTPTVGLPIGLNGYVDSVLTTESGLFISTES